MVIGFATQAAAREAADRIAWQIANEFPYDVFYPSAVRNHDGAGWVAQIANSGLGSAFRAIVLGPGDVDKYLAALERGEALIPHV